MIPNNYLFNKHITKIFLVCLLSQLTGCYAPEQLSELTYTPTSFDQLPNFKLDRVLEAYPALKKSCQVMIKSPQKNYPSVASIGLSGTYEDWNPFCQQILSLSNPTEESVRKTLEDHLRPYKISLGENDIGQYTGYYEPLLRGSKKRHGPYLTPLYRYPKDGTFVKYPRAKIVKGALKGKKLEIVWVDNPIDAFFLQIQGSGRVHLDNGQILKLGYAGTNGHSYYPIGKTLVEKGYMDVSQVSMQSIKKWLKEHPHQAESIMSENESYVFFKENNSDGPIGSQGVALTPERSLAVDPYYIGLGTPIWLDIESPHHSSIKLQHLAVAQDTGGAIKGALRADYFFGFGNEAGDKAGKMNSKGVMYILLPKK